LLVTDPLSVVDPLLLVFALTVVGIWPSVNELPQVSEMAPVMVELELVPKIGPSLEMRAWEQSVQTVEAGMEERVEALRLETVEKVRSVPVAFWRSVRRFYEEEG
jgi:hypothetical protein